MIDSAQFSGALTPIKRAKSFPAATAVTPDPVALAFDAVSTIISFSSWVLGILAAFLALVALIGWFTIHNGAVKAATDIAQKRLDSYLKDERFENLLAEKIDEIVRLRIAGMLVVSPKDKSPDDKPAFPTKEQSK